MNWFTSRRICLIGSAGMATVFAGFTICKLAGSEPDVSWKSGLLYSLLFGVFLIVGILCMKSRTALTAKIFYGE